MINIRTLEKLKNDDGMTLKNGKPVRYKLGYQVATEGIVTKDPKEAMSAIRLMKGNAGIWFSDGKYYIDKSHRVSTKKEALEVGRANNQFSVLRWKDLGLVHC